MAPSANFPTLGRQAYEAGRSMCGRRPKLYLAIGTFYDVERLRSAANALTAWGFSADGLWELVLSEPGTSSTAEATQDCRFQLRALPTTMLSGEEVARKSEKQVAWEDGTDFSDLCLDALATGNAAAETEQHLKHGATVLLVGTECSNLHDQCVKVLLRHSRHTVHSQEVNQPSLG